MYALEDSMFPILETSQCYATRTTVGILEDSSKAFVYKGLSYPPEI
jgi:hypothetical protein